MPFPAISPSGCILHLAVVCFHMIQRIYCINFAFLVLFPFQCRFFWELFWFYFTVKVAGGHVDNGQGKSPALILVTTRLLARQ